MLLRRPHDLAAFLRDGRARAGWSQTELAEKVGVSRQWISLVETGKTSVEFDLVVGTLQALGYRLRVESAKPAASPEPLPIHFVQPPTLHTQSERTPLTRDGKPLGRERVRRQTRDGEDA